ncbi:MAG TPA: DUF1318 domain-containing protein [Lentisphaeria bacterium]|nr:MAG: hypothetical protein A2X45_07010 [Lentisphaerae bacterium GWF2_50_93]HCE43335.1 DUF1318 domain-containing protein [Lentisphaeria bacterium]
MRTFIGKMVFLLMLAGFFFYASDGFGMDAKQRLAIVKGLKLKGIVGESNKGLLEFKTGDKSAQAVVDEENAERSKVYGDVAKKNGTSVAVVGAQRAAQISKDESAGVWIQDADGTWKKK